MNKPRPDDWAPLAKFFYADEALNCIGEMAVNAHMQRIVLF